MSGILRLESLTKGNTLKQGDKTPLKYRLFDADGEKLNIAGKSATVRLIYPDFLTIGYEKDGLTVAQDNTVTFTIDKVIPAKLYHVEIIVDDKFIFPSRADESKFTVDKSSFGTETNIIEIVGVDAVVKKAVNLINEDPSLIIDEDKLVSDIISNTGIGSIEEYYQQFNDVITELSEGKDYHSLPEIAGARGGFDTLGGRLDDTTAQLAQKLNKGNVSISDINKNLGKLDQTYMTDEFLQQMAGTTPINAIPAKYSITTDKLAFSPLEGIPSKNLFNKRTVELDKYLRADTGIVMDSSGNFASDFIRVKPSTTYTITPVSTVTRVNYYTETFVFIESSLRTSSATTPENAYFARISNAISNIDVTQFEEGSVPTSYTEYGTLFDVTKIRDNTLDGRVFKTKSITENLLEKTPISYTDAQVNLFNKDTLIYGKFIARLSGELGANLAYTASDFISVEGGETYTLGVIDQGAWYDENKSYISGVSTNDSNTIVAPTNAKFFRTSTKIEELSNQQFVRGTELSPTPMPYFGNLAEKILFMEEGTSNGISTPEDIARDVIFTEGSIIDLWGDSRVHGVGGTGYNTNGDIIPGTTTQMNPDGYCWANRFRDLMRDKYDVTVRNYGQSGRNSLNFYNQMETLTDQQPDLIILMLGTNDRHNLSSVESTKNYQRQMIELAHSKGIKVILMSAPPVAVDDDNKEIRNFGMYDLDKAMNELAQDFNMKHISNYDSALRYSEARGISHEELLADELHENDLGHDVIFRNVVRELGISYIVDGVTT